MQNQIEKVSSFLKSCESFRTSISAKMVLNLNDGFNVQEQIDKKNGDWRIFVDNVDTFFKIHQYGSWKVKFQSLISKSVINCECLDNIKVFFNSIINELQSAKQLGSNFIHSTITGSFLQ